MSPTPTSKASKPRRQPIPRKSLCICGCGRLTKNRFTDIGCYNKWRSFDAVARRMRSAKDGVFDFHGQDHPGEAARAPEISRLSPPLGNHFSLTASSLGFSKS